MLRLDTSSIDDLIECRDAQQLVEFLHGCLVDAAGDPD